MRIFYTFSLLLFIHWLISMGSAYGQQGSGFDPAKDEISGKLPPLSVLIDSAISNDPYIRFRDLQLVINNCKLKANRVEWTRNVGFQADVRYGNFYNYSINSSGGTDPAAIATNRLETKYGGSLYVKFPVYDFLNRRNQLKLAEVEIEQARSMSEVQRDETRQLVIRQYNDLVLKQRLLRIKAKYLETSRIKMQMVEKEFTNGIISVTEYARISEIVTRTEADFEIARVDFLTSYLILEEITGMKFNLTNAISGPNEGN
jgi:outer membrane protein TolC